MGGAWEKPIQSIKLSFTFVFKGESSQEELIIYRVLHPDYFNFKNIQKFHFAILSENSIGSELLYHLR